LTYSTFLGGSSAESIEAITLGADGTVHATGETHSSDFPTSPGAYDRTHNGNGYSDAFVSAFNATGTDLVYSTYLGGGYNDIGYGIVLGPGDTAYVTGRAQSDDFPTTPGAYDETFNGGNNDLFVTRLDAQGGSLVFSTYVGGNDHDDGTAIALDPAGNVYVVGFTDSPNYPTTPGAYDRTINSNIYSDAFVTKLNPTGSGLVYSTFLGGDAYDTGADLLLDADGTLTLTGHTYSANFPTTPGAYDRVRGGSGDAFVARFDPTGSSLLYSTFLGGTHQGIDVGAAIAPAAGGTVSVAGYTYSADFPTTPGAFDRSYNGEGDAFVATLRVVPPTTWR
jgi:hypothetical protein